MIENPYMMLTMCQAPPLHGQDSSCPSRIDHSEGRVCVCVYGGVMLPSHCKVISLRLRNSSGDQEDVAQSAVALQMLQGQLSQDCTEDSKDFPGSILFPAHSVVTWEV